MTHGQERREKMNDPGPSKNIHKIALIACAVAFVIAFVLANNGVGGR